MTRVEELLEARTPKYLARISHIDGEIVSVEHTKNTSVAVVRASKPEVREYYVPHDFEQRVKTGEEVKAKQILAFNPETKQKVTSQFSGIVSKVENGVIYVADSEAQTVEYVMPFGRKLLVSQ